LDAAGEYNLATCTTACIEPKYTCNESTWQCELTTPAGTSLSTCQAACIEPKYTCDTDTGQCDLTTPLGDSLATCQSGCTQYLFECDMQSCQCLRTASGTIDQLSICQFGCQPPETEDFFCDYLGQMCV
jgi:hypothetical protein